MRKAKAKERREKDGDDGNKDKDEDGGAPIRNRRSRRQIKGQKGRM